MHARGFGAEWIAQVSDWLTAPATWKGCAFYAVIATSSATNSVSRASRIRRIPTVGDGLIALPMVGLRPDSLRTVACRHRRRLFGNHARGTVAAKRPAKRDRVGAGPGCRTRFPR